jgi:hypothetical protein
MPWVISVSVDTDKTAPPAVGSATATFTDTDNTIFTYTQRDTLTAGNAGPFVAAAIAARDAWRTKKIRETNAATALVNSFTTAGETATAAVST